MISLFFSGIKRIKQKERMLEDLNKKNSEYSSSESVVNQRIKGDQ